MTSFAKMIPIVILGLAASVAMAGDVNCSNVANPNARKECAQHKAAGEVDCSKLSDPQARQQCAGKKHDNNAMVDCSKLSTPQQRQQCAKQKAN